MVYLACDLGAESGRVMAGELRDDRLAIREIHRFANEPLRRGTSLHWDIQRILDALRDGLRKAAALAQPFRSISTDSWGVDYVLFHENGKRIDPVFHYRDPRFACGVDRVARVASREEIFQETGIQFLPINTIYQLASEEPERLARASRLLPIADAFNFMLCGVAKTEESLASTTQLYNPRSRAWSRPLIDKLGFPARLFPPIVPGGAALAPLSAGIARETGLAPCDVVAGCSHDTAAAVAAVPVQSDSWAYISSGTWSLLGVEVPKPVLTDQCRALNFTNEVGFGGAIRLLKNIVGLWIVQECRRAWQRAGLEFTYAQLTSLAAESSPFRSLIHPADARFLMPDQMPEKIADYCRETDQPVPRTPGETVRCALESLALLYRQTARDVDRLMGRATRVMHIVGGGSQNALLNQFTANALQIPVMAGPSEATTAGNVLVQAIASGELKSLSQARELVARSFPIQAFHPADAAAWDSASRQFQALTCSHDPQNSCE